MRGVDVPQIMDAHLLQSRFLADGFPRAFDDLQGLAFGVAGEQVGAILVGALVPFAHQVQGGGGQGDVFRPLLPKLLL